MAQDETGKIDTKLHVQLCYFKMIQSRSSSRSLGCKNLVWLVKRGKAISFVSLPHILITCDPTYFYDLLLLLLFWESLFSLPSLPCLIYRCSFKLALHFANPTPGPFRPQLGGDQVGRWLKRWNVRRRGIINISHYDKDRYLSETRNFLFLINFRVYYILKLHRTPHLFEDFTGE